MADTQRTVWGIRGHTLILAFTPKPPGACPTCKHTPTTESGDLWIALDGEPEQKLTGAVAAAVHELVTEMARRAEHRELRRKEHV